MANRFDGKVVIITGGAAGIGKTAATLFGLEGAQVDIWDVNEAKLETTLAELAGKGCKVNTQVVNTANPEAAQAAAAATLKAHGSIDVLINNAGITRDATIKKMSYEQWQQVIDVNLTGVFNCTKAVVPVMIEQNGGCIINTSSVVGLYGNFGQANYSATKAGVIGMSKSLAKELGKHQIRVNAVAPGFIATEMIDTIPEKVLNMVVDKTPLRRMGKPEDIANTYLFLASDAAAFISGTVISVDGGITI